MRSKQRSKQRIGILTADEGAQQAKASLGSVFDVVLTTHDRNCLTQHARDGRLDVAALCNPDASLAVQLETARDLLSRGVTVAVLRPSLPSGVEGLGLVRCRIAGRPLIFLPAREITAKLPPLKRLFDIIVSMSVLTLGLIPCCLIALVIKFQDRGPVFFVQDRVGRGGRTFTFLKFRTMWPDADRHRAWYENRHGRTGQVFKLSDDPRRTPAGRVLRRLSLDEVPQFLHVLAGRMSLVGPRPPLPSEVERYGPWQHMRLAGWFGLTGLWQVCGRSEVRDLDDIVLLDAAYLRNHTFLLDLRIMLRTVRAVLSCRGAY